MAIELETRRLLLALACIPLMGQGYNIPFNPPGPGELGFCPEDAPTNIYCQDFEITGSDCTAESPAYDEDSADCGYTATVLTDGDVESFQITTAETASGGSAYTHSDQSCITFQLRVIAHHTSGEVEIYTAWEDDDTPTYPRIVLSGGSIFGRCQGSSDDTSTITVNAGTQYKVEMSYLNSGESGEIYVNDSASGGACDDTGGPTQNDAGFQWIAKDDTTDLDYIVDNFFITTGDCT